MIVAKKAPAKRAAAKKAPAKKAVKKALAKKAAAGPSCFEGAGALNPLVKNAKTKKG